MNDRRCDDACERCGRVKKGTKPVGECALGSKALQMLRPDYRLCSECRVKIHTDLSAWTHEVLPEEVAK